MNKLNLSTESKIFLEHELINSYLLLNLNIQNTPKNSHSLILGNIADKDDLFKENIVISFAEYVYYIVGGLNKFSDVAGHSVLLNVWYSDTIYQDIHGNMSVFEWISFAVIANDINQAISRLLYFKSNHVSL